MADIRIAELPLATGPTAPSGTDVVAIDGLTTRKTTLTALGDIAVPVASQAEAEAGVNASKRMTPLTTKQSIAFEVGVTLASKAQGDLADSALQPGDAATPAQGGKADTAVQPVDNRELSFNNKISVLDISDYANFHRINAVVNQDEPSDFASVNLNRTSGVTGGTGGSLNTTLRISNTVLNSNPYNVLTNPLGQGGTAYNGNSYEWGLGILFDNGRTHVGDDGYRGQNGGMFIRSRKMTANAGSTWGSNIFVFDYPGLSDPTELVCASEFDVHADGTDANKVRFGVSSVIKSTESTDGAPSGYGEGWAAFVAIPDPSRSGIASGDWKAKWGTGYYAAGEMDIAFDAADGTNPSATIPYHTPIAFRANYEQKVAFNAAGSLSLRGVASGNKLVFRGNPGSGEADVAAVDAFGNATFGGASPTVLAGYTWARVLNAGAGSAVLQVSAGNVDLRLSGTNAFAGEIGTYSDHVLLVKHNSNEKARVTSDGVHFLLSSVANTIQNGDMVIQATSNTQLTFKYRGSDGVTRSASLTMT